jgi:Domain of unknown function (DUF1840)
MLITFKTKAAAEVIMYKEHAKRILDLLQKDLSRGVLTAAETGPAIAKLEAEMLASRLHAPSEEVKHDIDLHHNQYVDDAEHEAAQEVGFAVRAYPLLELLRAAHKQGKDVVWGV